MLYYVLGVCSGIAACIFIWNIGKRTGGHNEGRIENALEREGVLQNRIGELERELDSSRGEVRKNITELRIIRDRLTQAEDKLRVTDRIADDLKERNGF